MGKVAALALLMLTTCYQSSATRIGPTTYEVSGRDSYEDARIACPYGWRVLGRESQVTGATGTTLGTTTLIQTMRRSTSTIDCLPPKDCPCEFGYACSPSWRYPGRQLCIVTPE